MKYSYDALVYWGEELDRSFERVARCGYDAIELAGDPEQLAATDHIRRLVERYELPVSSICSRITRERDLASSDPNTRLNAVTYFQDMVRYGSAVGAEIVIIAPTACGKTKPAASRETEQAWAVNGIRECAKFAADHGVDLVIEAWNRYETYWINRLQQALELQEAVGADNVGVMGDLFHMNLEEDDMAGAIRTAGERLFHLHIADSNRAAPGQGHIDFAPIVRTLRDIGYARYLSMELLPASAHPFDLLAGGQGREFYDDYTAQAIAELKAAWAAVG